VKRAIRRIIQVNAIRLDVALLAMVILVSAGASAAKPQKVAGNAANGKKLYAAQSCDACHMIRGKGGKTGPDLSKAGTKRTAQWMVVFLKNPRSKIPKGTMPPAEGSARDLQDLAAYMMTLK
jgi:mono/diheme cytochrome c family protein